MAQEFTCIEQSHKDFIERQRIFFTASSANGSHVNISPRSADAFRVLAPNRVAYLDRTGSGNETAAHLRAGGRVTIMFCAFEGPPMILRLYGRGGALLRGGRAYSSLLNEAFTGNEPIGSRQIILLEVALVKTSCGYGVPVFQYEKERPSMDQWSETKGEDGLEAYRRTHNVLSMDGLPTGLPDD